MPDTHSKVAQAVLRASKANGLDNAATAATAAAVSAASDALAPAGSQPESLSKVAEAAAAMGLTDAQARSAHGPRICGLGWGGSRLVTCIHEESIISNLRPSLRLPASPLLSDLSIPTTGTLFSTLGRQQRRLLPKQLQTPLRLHLKPKWRPLWQRLEMQALLFNSRRLPLQWLGSEVETVTCVAGGRCQRNA